MPVNTNHPPVHFHFLKGGNSLSNRSDLKSFIASLFKKEKKRLEDIHYVFCSDDYLLEINRQHLQHDYYTDIITFDLSEKGSEIISGEIYISVDRVRNNAKTAGYLISVELLRVIFHGVLHLCGYGDKKRGERAIMREKEDYYIHKYLNRST